MTAWMTMGGENCAFALMADCISTILYRTQLANIPVAKTTPISFKLNDYTFMPSVRLVRKIQTIENASLVFAGDLENILWCLKGIKSWQTEKLQYEEFAYKVLNAITEFNENDSFRSRPSKVEFSGWFMGKEGAVSISSNQPRMNTKNLGTPIFGGSGGEMLCKHVISFDQNYISHPMEDMQSVPGRLSSWLNAVLSHKEAIGVGPSDWGGCMDVVTYSSSEGWWWGPSQLHFTLFAGLRKDIMGTVSMGRRAMAYSPSSNATRILGVNYEDTQNHNIILAPFILKNLIERDEFDLEDDLSHWRGWKPEVCYVTVCGKPTGAPIVAKIYPVRPNDIIWIINSDKARITMSEESINKAGEKSFSSLGVEFKGLASTAFRIVT
jgi:hypothetical protein